jgi:tetratricopeptide (TPR) repeat protein
MTKGIIVLISLIIISVLYSLQTSLAQENTAESHKKQAISYSKDGITDKSIKEFEKAIQISYNEGYEKGKAESEKQKSAKIYAKYIILSIAVGLYLSAVFMAILWWSDISSQVSSIRRTIKINGFIGGIKIKLSPELRKQAIDIAKSEDKLRKAIKQENDPSLTDTASEVLPRLDELVRQALLLLELKQDLTDYIKDIDPSKLEREQFDCEEKIKTETDQEAKGALEYHLKQVKNKRENYAKAKARIRTCEAVLNGISARIDATSLDMLSLPSILIRKQEFFERVSAELDEEIDLTKNATESVMEESI